MESGKLRHRGTLESPPSTLTARGQIDRAVAWTTVATVRVGLRAAAAGEIVRGRQMVAEATHVLTIRYRSDVTTQWRMTIGARTFHFLAVSDPDDRRRELLIQARELV